MRVAVDARLVDYAAGGISQYTIRLVRAMAALPNAPELTVLQSRKASGSTPWPAACKRHRLITPPHNRYEQIALPIELLRVDAELLHSPDYIPPFRRRCKSVITVHDLAFLRFPSIQTPDSLQYYRQVGRAVRSADRVIAVSHATKTDILELLDCDTAKIDVVHEAPAPDCRPLSPEEQRLHRERLGLPERFVLFVSTIEPRKNLPVLLEAFARVWKSHRLPLVVVGRKGWLYEEVFGAVERLGLEEGVVFVGPVASDQLLYYYGCATCLAMPSLYEGFGLPALEAMACGTPVVVSNLSSLPEIVADAGLQVAPDDVEGLAEALSRLLDDEATHRDMSRRGIQRASQFSWERAARETVAVYETALHSR